jgi:Transposase DDE domain group 1
MVTTLQPKTPHTFKIEFADEPVTSFGGLVLAEKTAAGLGLWRTLAGLLPARRGEYDWPSAVKALIMGLLSGAQGTYATQALRQDAALLDLLSLAGAPEEVTAWRMLKPLGEFPEQGSLGRVQAIAARRTLAKMARRELVLEGFVPIFPDGTLLEGSGRREATKFIPEKGCGLMWSTVFVGPVLAAQRLAGVGEGEQSCVRAMLAEVDQAVLKPLKLHAQGLVLADSLHGDDPTLSQLEAARLHYVVGARKLALSEPTLLGQPETVWEDTGARPRLGWSASGVCCCWLQCEDWKHKRLLVGRRWMKDGEMLWNYCGVLTDLREKDVRPMLARGLSFARAIWRLYDAKAGMETLFKDGLSDLGLHHPPCREHVRNQGFYAVAALAWLVGVAVDVLGGADAQRGNTRRKNGGARARATPQRMRLWRLRRELWTLPGRVTRHARELTVKLLGVGETTRRLFELYWGNLSRC